MNTVVPQQPLDHFLARQLMRTLGQTDHPLLYNSIVALNTALRNGHSCLDLRCCAGQPVLADDPVVFPDLATWHNALSALPINTTDNAPLVLDQQRLYLRRYWVFEVELASALRARRQPLPLNATVEQQRQCLNRLFPLQPTFDWQRLAVANALDLPLSVLAGGPGTGKTYTVTRLLVALQQLSSQQLDIRLVAPTGKAAQRLSESIAQAKGQLLNDNVVSREQAETIPEQASTLHRLLGVIPNSIQFRHNEKHPLALDVLVIDEASMVDLPLMVRLFRALPTTARVIMIGDPDQLPSVATGSVLAELATRPHPGFSPTREALLTDRMAVPLSAALTATDALHARDHLVFLKNSRRFAAAGGIGRLALAIINGQATESWTLLNNGDDELGFQPQPLTQQLVQWCQQYYRQVLSAGDARQALNQFARFRILTAMRTGERGLNQQVELWAKKQGLLSINEEWYQGRPILVTENHYGLRLFNGDIGIVWQHDGRPQVAFIDTSSAQQELRWFSPGRLPRHQTVWAMTIHKTQGSEFDAIGLVLPQHPSPLLSRELLYTGLTRARQKAFIVTDEAIWKQAVEQRVERYSGLGQRLFQHEGHI